VPFGLPVDGSWLSARGTKTELSYFRETRNLERSLIELELSPEGVTKTLVERAVRMKREAAVILPRIASAVRSRFSRPADLRTSTSHSSRSGVPEPKTAHLATAVLSNPARGTCRYVTPMRSPMSRWRVSYTGIRLCRAIDSTRMECWVRTTVHSRGT
jgi:hypothetical protein